ncbi:MAG: flagellar motor switch protein FliG [Actinomycetota bacterium]|jgi:flagellar motor switch protein FliG|nr:flagellar motor switch protein FliG [Actinomycetota bacterium]
MGRDRALTGAQKAAVFILHMGKERSAEVLRSMRETEVAEIMGEVARMRTVTSTVIDEVVDEFKEMADAKVTVTAGGLERARSLLTESLGGDKATEILDRVTASLIELPFEFLRRADPRQVLSFIQDEHPQTVALVLAYMTPDQAAMVMSGLSEDLQRDVAMRLAVMDRTSPEVVAHVEQMLERKLSSVLQPSELSSVGGVQSLVDILNRSDRATERLILEGLENKDSELADEVRQRMFVFEDIAGLDDRSIQLVLRQVDSKELAVALKGVRAEVRTAITRNMSERAGANLVEEIALLGAVRLKTVEEAQGAIVRVVRALEESGQLVLVRSADEFVE